MIDINGRPYTGDEVMTSQPATPRRPYGEVGVITAVNADHGHTIRTRHGEQKLPADYLDAPDTSARMRDQRSQASAPSIALVSETTSIKKPARRLRATRAALPRRPIPDEEHHGRARTLAVEQLAALARRHARNCDRQPHGPPNPRTPRPAHDERNQAGGAPPAPSDQTATVLGKSRASSADHSTERHARRARTTTPDPTASTAHGVPARYRPGVDVLKARLTTPSASRAVEQRRTSALLDQHRPPSTGSNHRSD